MYRMCMCIYVYNHIYMYMLANKTHRECKYTVYYPVTPIIRIPSMLAGKTLIVDKTIS